MMDIGHSTLLDVVSNSEKIVDGNHIIGRQFKDLRVLKNFDRASDPLVVLCRRSDKAR